MLLPDSSPDHGLNCWPSGKALICTGHQHSQNLVCSRNRSACIMSPTCTKRSLALRSVDIQLLLVAAVVLAGQPSSMLPLLPLVPSLFESSRCNSPLAERCTRSGIQLMCQEGVGELAVDCGCLTDVKLHCSKDVAPYLSTYCCADIVLLINSGLKLCHVMGG